jgi:hypothetical protein
MAGLPRAKSQAARYLERVAEETARAVMSIISK